MRCTFQPPDLISDSVVAGGASTEGNLILKSRFGRTKGHGNLIDRWAGVGLIGNPATVARALPLRCIPFGDVIGIERPQKNPYFEVKAR